MNFKDKLVAHCEVHFLDLAFVEANGTKGNIIDLRVVEITIVKRAIDKGNAYKSPVRKRTMVKNTSLKISMVQDTLAINLVGIGFV